MFRIFFGLLLGIVLVIAFIYLGGAEIVQDLGKESKKVERSLKTIENKAKKRVDHVGDAMEGVRDEARDTAKEVSRKLKRIKEKVSGQIEDNEELEKLIEELDAEGRDE